MAIGIEVVVTSVVKKIVKTDYLIPVMLIKNYYGMVIYAYGDKTKSNSSNYKA